MANVDIQDVITQLDKAHVSGQLDNVELSFAGEGRKLDDEKDVEYIVNAIQSFPNLKVLRLEGNTFGVDAAKAIAKALEAHPELERALWKDMFTGRLKSEIPKALMFLGSGLMLAGARLVELDLSDNAFGPVGIEGIVETLKSSTCYTLKELRLNNNGLGINGGKLLSKALLDCHENSTRDDMPLKLKTFVCGRNRLENEGAKAIAEVFKVLATLEEVQMPQNSIFFEGIDALAKGLQENPQLRCLNLNDNIFKPEGAKSMAEALPKLQNLEIINFGDCLIKSEGAIAIAGALKTGHHKLRELNLGFNELDRYAAEELVDILKDKELFQKLELNGNAFGDEGREVIRSILDLEGKENILGSLSDDEEVESKDDDDDNDDDEGVEDDDDHGKEEDDVIGFQTVPNSNDYNDDFQYKQTDVTPIKSTPNEFLQCPTAARLLGLGNNKADALLKEAKKDSRGIEKYVDIFIKVSLDANLNNDDVKKAACECTDAVLAKGFKEAEEADMLFLFTNAILVYLGLIKSEDKTVKPPSDLSGPLIVLEHAVRQSYFPKATKDILQLFLSRFHLAVEQTGQVKHRLMQTLYQ